MTRTSAALGSVLFFFLAPGLVAGLVPWLLTGWRAGASAAPALSWLGILVIVAGLVILLDCFRRFAIEGLGTPAPVAPTARLVVRGIYRFVRNPMYVAVVSIILGQAMLFASLAVLVYAVVAWTTMHLFVISYEETTLKQQFPADYPAYFAAVPRWIPRLTPWQPDKASPGSP